MLGSSCPASGARTGAASPHSAPSHSPAGSSAGLPQTGDVKDTDLSGSYGIAEILGKSSLCLSVPNSKMELVTGDGSGL